MAHTNGKKRRRSDSTASSSSTPARKRRTSNITDSDSSPTRKPIECAVCMESKLRGQFKKFPSCPINPCNRTCNFCCTRHVKISLIENPLTEIACFSCAELIPRQILVDRFLKSKEDKEHYQFRLKQAGLRERNERECIFGDCIHFQIHDPAVDGRLITCEKCCRRSCHPCMAPEHSGETCEEYQSRLQAAHAAEEAATNDAFAHGYIAMEQIGRLGRSGRKEKKPVHCPGCGLWTERAEGCRRGRCPTCKMEFCIGCGAKYLGRNSVAAKGNAAHGPGCKNVMRAKEDMRFVQRKDDRPRVRGRNNPSRSGEELEILRKDAGSAGFIDYPKESGSVGDAELVKVEEVSDQE